jgi:4,5-DOPA dioxygenase extradiol
LKRKLMSVLFVGHGSPMNAIEDNEYSWPWRGTALDLAVEYDQQVKQWLLEGNDEAIIHHERHGKSVLLSVNSAEHYLPLLYILGLKEGNEPISFFAEKLWGGSLSMRCVRFS